MINIKAVGLYSSDFSSGETRLGDAQVITDGTYFEVIDGYCDRGATRLIADLKSRSIKRPYLHISHPHYDHRDGIDKILSDSYFSPRGLYCQDPNSITGHNASIRSDIDALKRIIQKAKNKGVPVVYLSNEQKVQHGDIKFTVYRQYPKYTGNSDAYLNDGSLCYWFAELRYLTTGDASMWCAYKYGLNPLIVKGGHHGNDMSADGYLKPSQMCVWLYNKGCRFYWDNDFSTRLTDFLMTGRDDAINAGMTFIDIHGDIVMTFASGKVMIKHGSRTYTASVPYKGGGMTGSWEKGSKGWWYRYSDGSFAKGWTQIKYNGRLQWFLFDEDGWMQTGWQKDNGKWYFLDYKTGAMKIGWHKLPYGDGKEGWFLLGKDGAMLTGWQYSNKDGKAGWYYLDPKTGVMKTGWVYDGGEWYCLGEDGRMLTGWVTYKGRKCYLEPLSDKNHVQGVCYRNRTAVIGGKTYRFDKDGYAEEIGGQRSFLHGVDIASYQSGINPARLSTTDFVIVKFTQGTSYLNPYADRQYSMTKSAGKLLGAYHYAEGKSATTEAQYFVKHLGNRIGECILALDWEGNQNPVFGTGKDVTWCKSFLDEVYRLTGVRPLIYMSKSVCRKYNWSSVAKDYPLWCAQYKTNSITDYQHSPWTDDKGFGAWKTDTIRQYSSHGRIAGYDANIDIDLAYMSADQWRAMAGQKVQENPIDVALSIAGKEVGTHEGANNQTKYGDEMHSIQLSNMDKNAPWCFTAGTMILTSKGYKPIENIEFGDLVLNAYGNSFNVVQKTMNRKSLVNEIRAYGTLKMLSTSDHPFLCNQRLGVRKDWKHTDVEFRPLNKISHGDNVVIPATNEFEDIKLTYDEAWSVGYFVGDGWKTSRGEYRICGNDAKEKEVFKHFVGIEKEKDYASRTCHEYRIRIDKNSNIVPLLDLAGIGAENKVVPAPILFANTEIKKAFLDGYMTADGTKEGRFSTISKALALGVARLVFDIGYGCSIRECVRNENQIIYDNRINDYRPIKIKPIIYCGSINANPSKQRRMDRRDGNLIFVPVKYNNETGEEETVYNITVGGDHTYLANNLAVHNCDAFVDWVIYKTCQHFGKGAETARKVLCGDFDDYTYNSVNLYKKAGRWSNTPHRGDQIFFGGSGHTGIVESVEGGTLHTIEGNKSDEVRRCSYIISTPSIIGYGRPRYDLITGQITANDMPLLKKGSTGSEVERLQNILNAKGYKLDVDGSFGSKTESAVKAYQRANGLTADGECGEKTWTSLFMV